MAATIGRLQGSAKPLGTRRGKRLRSCASATQSNHGRDLEPWEENKRKARDVFRDRASRMIQGEKIDVLEASLAIAAEDDAFRSASPVMLPIESFLQRADSMAEEIAARHLSERPSGAHKVAQAIHTYLYDVKGFSCPQGIEQHELKGMREIARHLPAPMRMYQHNVMTQKVGTPPALAILHEGIEMRLRAGGYVDGKLETILPPGNDEPETRRVGEAKAVYAGERTATPHLLLWEILHGLKKAYWPWNWDAEEEGGFLGAAKAALESKGRVGKAHLGTIVPTEGRPMGDLESARAACERLVELQGRGGSESRDLGALLLHLDGHGEAEGLLKEYAEQNPHAVAPGDFTSQLLNIAQRTSLENAFKAPPASDTSF